MKKRFNLHILMLTFLLLTLGTISSANAALIKFSATIDGAQANAGAGTGSLGTGIGTMWLDDVTNAFSWEISWSGLMDDVTAAHFHGPALPNANAGVQIPIAFNVNPSSGNAVLIAQQATDLMNGLWYVNIHTSFAPGGEIRGQVLVDVPAPATIMILAVSVFGLICLRRRPNR